MILISENKEYIVEQVNNNLPNIVEVKRKDGIKDNRTGLIDKKSLDWQIERNFWKKG